VKGLSTNETEKLQHTNRRWGVVGSLHGGGSDQNRKVREKKNNVKHINGPPKTKGYQIQDKKIEMPAPETNRKKRNQAKKQTKQQPTLKKIQKKRTRSDTRTKSTPGIEKKPNKNSQNTNQAPTQQERLKKGGLK